MRWLQLRPLIFISVAVFITSLVAVVLFRQAAQRSLWDQSRSQAETVASLLASQIDADLHLQLWQTRDQSLYDQLLAPLVESHRHLPEVYYLYTLVHEEGEDRFVLDTAAQPELVSHGRELEASDMGELSVDESPEEDRMMRDHMSQGLSYSYEEPYIDDYGTFMVAHAPIGGRGEGGFIGVDYDISSIADRLSEIDQYAWLAAGMATILSVMVGLAGMIILRREQQRRIDVEETAEAQARLYAMISHDIRTPLNGIMGSLELIDQVAVPSSERRHLQTIASCSDTMLGLFNDILDFHKFEHQAMPILPKQISIRHLIDESVAWTTSRSDLDEPQFEVSIDPEIPDSLRVDPLRLRQLLINLLSNAARYGGGHPVALRVTSDGPYMLMSIRDRGAGMSEDVVATIFEPFVRGKAGQFEESSTGLGLAIVKTIVDAMGEIQVHSRLGEGTDFSVKIPITDHDGRLSDVKSDVPAAPKSGDTTSIRLIPIAEEPFLVVDDLHLNRVLLRDMLVRLGYQSQEANSGEEALAILEKARFSCIMIDINLPGMSGIEIIKQIRANRSHRHCTIVTVTGDQFPETTQRSLQAGADYCLTKPLRLIDLKRVVNDFLDLSMVRHSSDG